MRKAKKRRIEADDVPSQPGDPGPGADNQSLESQQPTNVDEVVINYIRC